MNDQTVNHGRVSWRELCPWAIIFRTLPVATSISVLGLAFLGVVLTPVGWRVSEFVFVSESMQQSDPQLTEMVQRNRSLYGADFWDAENQSHAIEIFGFRLEGTQLVFERIVQPFYTVFGECQSFWEFCYVLFGSVWSMLVWSFLGVGIARICLLRLTRDDRAGLDDAFDYSVQKFMTAMLAVSLPMLAVFLICVPTFLLGLIMGFDLGTVVVGFVWILVLALSTVMAVLLAGLLFGWPLVISSVACEGQNSFDAMTRAFAYTFQRPLNYLLYIVIAIFFGGFCWLLASHLTDGIVNLGYWSTSWGTNAISSDRMDLIQFGVASQPLEENSADVAESVGKSLETGRYLIGLAVGFARTVCVAFMYGLFWCMASAIYLLLRKDVDEMEMDEIYIVDERRTYQLPALKSDESGIPQVQSLEVGGDGDDPDDSDVG